MFICNFSLHIVGSQNVVTTDENYGVIPREEDNDSSHITEDSSDETESRSGIVLTLTANTGNTANENINNLCYNFPADTMTVAKQLDDPYLERLVVYYYGIKENNSFKTIKIYIPDRRKQYQMPEWPLENTDILMPANRLKFFNIMKDNPFVLSRPDFTRPYPKKIKNISLEDINNFKNKIETNCEKEIGGQKINICYDGIDNDFYKVISEINETAMKHGIHSNIHFTPTLELQSVPTDNKLDFLNIKQYPYYPEGYSKLLYHIKKHNKELDISENGAMKNTFADSYNFHPKIEVLTPTLTKNNPTSNYFHSNEESLISSLDKLNSHIDNIPSNGHIHLEPEKPHDHLPNEEHNLIRPVNTNENKYPIDNPNLIPYISPVFDTNVERPLKPDNQEHSTFNQEQQNSLISSDHNSNSILPLWQNPTISAHNDINSEWNSLNNVNKLHPSESTQSLFLLDKKTNIKVPLLPKPNPFNIYSPNVKDDELQLALNLLNGDNKPASPNIPLGDNLLPWYGNQESLSSHSLHSLLSSDGDMSKKLPSWTTDDYPDKNINNHLKFQWDLTHKINKSKKSINSHDFPIHDENLMFPSMMPNDLQILNSHDKNHNQFTYSYNVDKPIINYPNFHNLPHIPLEHNTNIKLPSLPYDPYFDANMNKFEFKWNSVSNTNNYKNPSSLKIPISHQNSYSLQPLNENATIEFSSTINDQKASYDPKLIIKNDLEFPWIDPSNIYKHNHLPNPVPIIDKLSTYHKWNTKTTLWPNSPVPLGSYHSILNTDIKWDPNHQISNGHNLIPNAHVLASSNYDHKTKYIPWWLNNPPSLVPLHSNADIILPEFDRHSSAYKLINNIKIQPNVDKNLIDQSNLGLSQSTTNILLMKYPYLNKHHSQQIIKNHIPWVGVNKPHDLLDKNLKFNFEEHAYPSKQFENDEFGIPLLPAVTDAFMANTNINPSIHEHLPYDHKMDDLKYHDHLPESSNIAPTAAVSAGTRRMLPCPSCHKPLTPPDCPFCQKPPNLHPYNFRILGGTAATGTGRIINNKGRSGNIPI